MHDHEATSSEPQTRRRTRRKTGKSSKPRWEMSNACPGQGSVLAGDKKTGEASPLGMGPFQKHLCDRAANLGGLIREDHLQALVKDRDRSTDELGA